MASDSLLIEKLKQYREYIFRSHSQYILEAYLEQWIKKIVHIRSTKNTKCTAIIIEDRPSDLLKFSIYNTLDEVDRLAESIEQVKDIMT